MSRSKNNIINTTILKAWVRRMPTECRRARPPENRLYRRGQSPSGEAALTPPQGDFLENRQPYGKWAIPFFLQMQKNNGKKKKQQRANSFAKLLLAFLQGLLTILGKKKTKKWHLQWEYFWNPSYPENQLFFRVSPWNVTLCGTSWPDLRHHLFGEEMGKIAFHGENMGKILNANQPISKPGIKPSSLLIWRHQNIALSYIFFNVYL